ncbi:glycosyltransferase [Virgibacillus sp. C22-A2]|uniref:Glycosyltransferase n=1 Tax=Virgibacillus tibetensis TaxID=3042313 RepID=A0ABU6KFY4_9BACI|nr:glycosyltransferase [Virgibacillus sp. C22-A2]
MSPPTISIIVPVYNVEAYLRKCLDSIIAQTFTNFEVILVNDGSTDDSGVICDEYAAKDSRIIVVHKEYGGVSSARNAGVELVKGDYIGFVDGDDYIEKDMYLTLFHLCQENESDIAICNLGRVIDGKLINGGNHEVYIKEFTNEEGMSELFKGVLYRFSLCNKLFSRKCFQDIQFPEGRIHEDLSTTYKLFANAQKIVYSNFLGYIYVKRNNSILTSRFNQSRLDAFIGWNEILVFMKKNYDQILEDVVACYGYWCVDNIYYILNQIPDKTYRKIYLKNIQKNLLSNYEDVMKNKLLSFKYKYIVSMMKYNLRFLVFSNQVKRVFRNQSIG